MAIVVETCPRCGHDLVDLTIATYPPIPQKKCFECGWLWTGEPEEIIRVPFGGNSFNYDTTYTLRGNTDYECINGLATTMTTYGGGAIGMTEATEALTTALKDFEDKLINGSLMGEFEQSACVNCPNNIKNGGSGICHCILGQMQIT